MIRSLSRGLEVLTVLNRRDSATAAEIARELAAPRASIYRILETLQTKGFVYQHNSDRRFRITLKVRTLSDGFTDEAHMANISRPFLSRLTRKYRWPMTMATISGIDLIVRENTDQESPFATERFTIGYRMPVLNTASGLCILANMSERRRKVILDMLSKTDRSYEKIIKRRKALAQIFDDIRINGYSINHRHRRVSDMTAISVPILTGPEAVRGAVTIRYARKAITATEAVDRFVPALHNAANGIAQRIQLHLERQQKTHG